VLMMSNQRNAELGVSSNLHKVQSGLQLCWQWDAGISNLVKTPSEL